MYMGKILEIYAFKNGRHEWIVTASNRKSISYLALQIYFYKPELSVSSYREETPDRFTWCLIDCAHVHYLFPKSESENPTEVPGDRGVIFLPRRARQMLLAMAQPNYISDVEATLASIKRRK